MKHGGRTVSIKRVVHKVKNTLHNLAKLRFYWLPSIPLLWPDMIRFFEAYKPIVITKRVTWQLPNERWFKCYTDGASRGNPGPSSYGFCVRNYVGDVVFTKAEQIGNITNMVAEVRAIMQGPSYCI